MDSTEFPNAITKACPVEIMGLDGDDVRIDMPEIMSRRITLGSFRGHARVSGKRGSRTKLFYSNWLHRPSGS